ncbi:MAG: TolC family protein, partial [Puniceicoccaceae bacterium]
RLVLFRSYMEAAPAQMMAALAREQNSPVEAFFGNAGKILKKTPSPRLQLLDWRIAYADAVLTLSEKEEEAATLLRRLADAQPGLDSEAEIILQIPSLELEGTIPSPGELSRSILESDPRLAERLAAVRIANASVAAERARRIPFPTFIQGSWVHDQRRDTDEWEARIGISIPVFSWTRDVDPRERAEVILAERALILEKEELQQMAVQVHREWQAASKRFSQLESAIQPIMAELETTLADPRLPLDPGDRIQLIEDQYQLQRDLLEARLQFQLAAWTLHTLVWDWN